MPTRVVIGGPRGSGKSTLVASVYRQLECQGVSVGLHEVDVYSDTIPCILGQKPWEERIKKKHAWFNPTIKRRIEEFAADRRGLVLGDLPGKVTNPFLPRMVEPAHQAIIVARDWGTMEAWQKFFAAQGIPVVLRIVSYQGELPEDRALPKDALLVGNLNRSVVQTPEIVRVAERIASVRTPVLRARAG